MPMSSMFQLELSQCWVYKRFLLDGQFGFEVCVCLTPSQIDLPKYLLLISLKSSKAPTNYFTPNILRKSWSRLVVSVVHLDALAFPVAAT